MYVKRLPSMGGFDEAFTSTSSWMWSTRAALAAVNGNASGAEPSPT
jgi:hypothetical protein